MATLVDSLVARRDTQGVLFPPLNFAMVVPGVYRSGHPNKGNFPFLDTLTLKSIMYLSTDNYRHDTYTWARRKGLKIVHLRLDISKDPAVEVDPEMIKKAIEVVLDSRNLPILIHDNKGRIVPSIISAILRLMCDWSLDAALAEYRKFFPSTEDWVHDDPAEIERGAKKKKDKERIADLRLIERFDLRSIEYDPDYAPSWLER
ncbi:hypothetical protein NBRC10512_007227 [Rhodotorula toruloides]|uniref:RHTO0S15e02190g1_1 n=2 Tax=Rhodotorula toruloides TaxID=5286 RepID=A0A061BIT1_RHOTO|nr:protein tyrosine phosphatase [Rhodotorula toruloides NP11]EMS25479.1 protein tyrosine phosphatase [Rhodotorula toruloides NP11]CDR47804.1 RHTO0S15e02190g1_1 [Rhodotorula toruloides]